MAVMPAAIAQQMSVSRSDQKVIADKVDGKLIWIGVKCGATDCHELGTSGKLSLLMLAMSEIENLDDA
jgi:hypothetical protein